MSPPCTDPHARRISFPRVSGDEPDDTEEATK